MTTEKLYDIIKAWRDHVTAENGDGVVMPVNHK